MAASFRRRLVTALLAIAATAQAASGQAPGPVATTPPALGSPVVPPPAVAGPGAWPPPEYRLPPVDTWAQPAHPDHLLEEPTLPPAGWYFSVEAAAVGASVKDHISGPVTVSPDETDNIISLRTRLNWTVSPRFELGYRLPKGYGEFLASYSFLTTDGTGPVPSSQGTFQVKNRLSINTFDFDYANRNIVLTLSPRVQVRWKVGIEAATYFYDSQAKIVNPADAFDAGPTSTLTQYVATRSVGAGPHAGLEFWYRLPVPGLSVYAQGDAASMYMHQDQTFTETVVAPDGAATLSGSNRMSQSQGMGVLGAQAGLHWSPPGRPWTSFFLGYQWHYYEQLGRQTGATPSNSAILVQGFFLRGEFSF
jgi:hypothetical protein